MNMSFYLTLAKTNIKKNSKHSIPFILTCICTIMMFYMMCFLTNNKGVSSTGGATGSMLLQEVLFLGTIVIGIFAVIFLLYTNSFLIKQRKKEFALYHILGMEKKHISKIIAIETLIIAVISFSLGIALGIIFSKLMVLLVYSLLSFDVPYGFEISFKSIGITLLVFAAIYSIMLLNNIKQVFFTNTIELLKGSNSGEKEPKTKWLMAAAGIICIGIGYYFAITVKSPVEALPIFLLAVILVIFGTYFIFIAGSIVILKLLRKNKGYYYKTKHFISVSGMIYRMKQNAAGLASICILSTMVLIMISTTTSLYLSLEDNLRYAYPRDLIVTVTDANSKYENGMPDSLIDSIKEAADINQVEMINNIHYSDLSFNALLYNDQLIMQTEYYNDSDSSGISVYFITISDYNSIHNKNISLKENEVLIYTKEFDYKYDNISISNSNFIVKEHLMSIDTLNFRYDTGNRLYIVISDRSVINDNIKTTNFLWRIVYGFDSHSDSEKIISLFDDMLTLVRSGDYGEFLESGYYLGSSEQSRTEFITLYGGLFFLGIFLSILFIMAAVLIMYYKQISEGYDDKKRFEIMQNVGMNHSEIKKSIHSQILLVFFLPIITAGIHVAAAFKLITRLMALLNMTNEKLFLACTLICLLIFAVFYTLVYMLTARTYYKIVK